MRGALLLCLWFAACPKPPLPPPSPTLPAKPKEPQLEVSTQNIKRDLEYLTSKELEGRGRHTQWLSLAAEYIAEQMREANESIKLKLALASRLEPSRRLRPLIIYQEAYPVPSLLHGLTR